MRGLISKAEFIAKLRRRTPSITGEEAEFDDYEEAVVAAENALATMPSIGFASMKKRSNAFVAVCRHLDAMVEHSEIDAGGAQLAISIMRLSHKPFLKAAIAFDINGPRLGIPDLVQLPEAAREYLAGLKLYG